MESFTRAKKGLDKPQPKPNQTTTTRTGGHIGTQKSNKEILLTGTRESHRVTKLEGSARLLRLRRAGRRPGSGR